MNLRGPEILIVIALAGLAIWLLVIKPRSRLRQDQSTSRRATAIQQPVLPSPTDGLGAQAGASEVAAGNAEAPPVQAAWTGYRRADNTFHGSLGTVVQYATLALSDLGWPITGTSEMARTLTFETPMSMGSWSGITGTLSFFEVGPNVWRVSGAGKQNVRGAQLVALDMGGANNAINRLLIKMQAVAPVLD